MQRIIIGLCCVMMHNVCGGLVVMQTCYSVLIAMQNYCVMLCWDAQAVLCAGCYAHLVGRADCDA